MLSRLCSEPTPFDESFQAPVRDRHARKRTSKSPPLVCDRWLAVVLTRRQDPRQHGCLNVTSTIGGRQLSPRSNPHEASTDIRTRLRTPWTQPLRLAQSFPHH